MRKSYLILAAVATILASCAENSKINNDLRSDETKTVIGFSSYSEKATRGVNNAADLEYYHGTFTVYGSKKSTIDNTISEVFDGGSTALLTYEDGATSPNDWKYTPYRFWDKQASYNFIAVAPNAHIVKYDWNAQAQSLVEVGNETNDFVTVDGGYTLGGQNLQKTATSAEITKGFVGGNGDTDIMTSGLASQAAGNTNTVNLAFKHILAKLNVTIAKAKVLNDADVYIQSLEIKGLKDKGTYDESTYFAGKAAVEADPTATPPVEAQAAVPAVSGWTATYSDDAPHAYTLSYSYANDANKIDGQFGAELGDYDVTNNKTVPTYFIESLVMPQAVAGNTATLTLKYQIVTGSGENAHKEIYTYQFDMNNAFASYLDRHNYKLNLTIQPDVITFDATSDVWLDGGTFNQPAY
ncbi:MAG: fimbrillin family protein [Bacteroidaceae bacterium]|nr:fimbrillin family protein [Bacteroidaceae bacterium]